MNEDKSGPCRQIPNWGRENYVSIRQELENVNWEELLSSKSTFDMWELFKDLLIRVQNRHIPEKDMEDSEISVEHSNMLGHFEIKKEVVLGLLKSIEEVMRVIDKGRAVDVVYMDFNKVFDKVPHGRLIQKTKMYGIH
eukprot:g22831.t1